MPFKSEAQRRFLFAKHPDIAQRWSREYPGQHKLPAHVGKEHKPKSDALERALFARGVDR